MDVFSVYQIKVQGQVEEREINAMSPLQINDVRIGQAVTVLVVHTDQSGMVGLIRHLHGRGFVFLSISQEGRLLPLEEI